MARVIGKHGYACGVDREIVGCLEVWEKGYERRIGRLIVKHP